MDKKWPRFAHFYRLMMDTWRVAILVSHLGLYLKLSMVIKKDFKELVLNE